ncbi:hypothetical protein B0T11DRAFT_270606 [Plectosphaerella cucumerina]|uniref:RRN7-type domain-containing protein n=1 Tax=Plectosphaerella cucumerina TaxID=40658 RepID=A0A8K0X890_9PEZI|nr:hypothetical protein B0T11DRAFT_270606 [Plectosphaerella cucumerina]
MDAGTRDLRKFAKGERCAECGTRRYFWEGGRQYCSEGHQIEGVVQYDMGEDAFGTTGRTYRKQKEAKVHEKRKLTGRAARDLYLECLQLLLRKQIEWLTDAKGHKAELETVVRDLWDLRIRGSPGDGLQDLTSDGDMSGNDSRSRASSRERRASSWGPETGGSWPAPRVSDTLALCYLGCLLLRIPTKIGDFVKWARGGNIVYKQAYLHLPNDAWTRLPATYQSLFQAADSATFDDGELHSVVMNLALSFRLNYEMEFPPLNDVLITLQYVRELGLPLEILSVVRRVPRILGLDYSFPSAQPRIRAIDHPEILLVSIVVLATQYCFPFEDVGLPDQHGTYVQIPQMDWAKWEELMAPIMNRARDSEELDYKTVTAADITNMTPEQLEKYFTHMSLQLDNAGDENDTAFLAKFFPTEKARPFPPQEEDTDQAVNTRAVDVQEQAVAFGKSSVEQQLALERYYSYKRLEDLPPHGRMFYDLAARLAGLSSLSLLKAVNMLELQVRAWKRRQVLLEAERRQVRESREGGIDEGPPNPDYFEVLDAQEDDETVVNTS